MYMDPVSIYTSGVYMLRVGTVNVKEA